MDKEKIKAVDAAVSQIQRSFGKGAIMRMGDIAGKLNIETISTGVLPLDHALGAGGLPRGRIVEMFGPESTGKTSLALHCVAEAQKGDGVAAFIDVEHALDPVYAKKLGVNTDELLIAQPSTGEEALEITETLVRSGAVDIIVVDSVAALVPKAEIEGSMGDSHMGVQARLMSQALRKLTGAVSKSKTICVFINQIREKIGIMFGSPITTPGGRALKFYSSVRLEIKRKETLKKGDTPYGNKVIVKVAKNKVAPPFRQAIFDMYYGSGVSKENCIIDLAIEHKIITKSGSWYSYGDKQLGQGKDNARAFLMENQELFAEIEKKVKDVLFPKETETETQVEEKSKAKTEKAKSRS